jgi:hypothetical protein
MPRLRFALSVQNPRFVVGRAPHVCVVLRGPVALNPEPGYARRASRATDPHSRNRPGRIGPGGSSGLQNRHGLAKTRAGGFDSHTLPPLSHNDFYASSGKVFRMAAFVPGVPMVCHANRGFSHRPARWTGHPAALGPARPGAPDRARARTSPGPDRLRPDLELRPLARRSRPRLYAYFDYSLASRDSGAGQVMQTHPACSGLPEWEWEWERVPQPIPIAIRIQPIDA